MGELSAADVQFQIKTIWRRSAVLNALELFISNEDIVRSFQGLPDAKTTLQ